MKSDYGLRLDLAEVRLLRCMSELPFHEKAGRCQELL